MFSDSDLNSRQILQKNSCLICWIIQQMLKKIIIGATWTCLQLRKVQKYFLKGKNVLLHWIYSLIYFKCFFSPKYTIQGKAEGIEPAYYSIVWADRYNWPNHFFLESKYLRYPNNFISTVSIQYGHFLILCYMNLWKLSWKN